MSVVLNNWKTWKFSFSLPERVPGQADRHDRGKKQTNNDLYIPLEYIFVL